MKNMNKGKIIVIEGTDSSGKELQSNLLYERLKKEGLKVKKISFPNYSSPACEPVKMYLAGEFGENPEEINPYSISTMYAIDRFASFKKDWSKFYEEGGIIITDRYTTSNMVHQASKIKDENDKIEYFNWLKDLEYDKMKIPEPNIVIFLNMPPEFSRKLMKDRKNKITGDKEKDIHEKDIKYLENSYYNACGVAKVENWREIKCVKEDRLRDIDNIADEIFQEIKDII